MAITQNYHGQTFVAFTDIEGFSAMMSHEGRLMRAMDALYSSGYRTLGAAQQRTPRVEGVFISDCGILFSRRTNETEWQALESLLKAVSQIHREVFESAFSLTTAIAFGEFTYRSKIEFEGLEKNAIHGNAYVAAYQDHENRSKKLYPNECRILKRGLPQGIDMEAISIARGKMRDEDDHFYFDWMKLR
jgi:hypothetical protein